MVDFYAVWCGPCKLLAPILEDIAGEYQGRVAFYKLDAEQLVDLSSRYEIQAYPTVLMFSNGEQVARWVGLGNRDYYTESIDHHLANAGASLARPAELKDAEKEAPNEPSS